MGGDNEVKVERDRRIKMPRMNLWQSSLFKVIVHNVSNLDNDLKMIHIISTRHNSDIVDTKNLYNDGSIAIHFSKQE
jgi:hypothetical protein